MKYFSERLDRINDVPGSVIGQDAVAPPAPTSNHTESDSVQHVAVPHQSMALVHPFFGGVSRSIPSYTLEIPTESSSEAPAPSTTDLVELDSTSPDSIPVDRQPPKSLQCVFPIEWNKITFDRKAVPTIRYRIPHKRTLHSRAKISPIYKYGAQLTTNGNNKFWLCKFCHLNGDHDGALYSSEATSSISYHLKMIHKLEKFGYVPSAKSNPFEDAKGVRSAVPPESSYFGSRPLPFDLHQFKDDYLDWVIDLDLTFRQATHRRTRALFGFATEEVDRIIPQSATTLSSWIRDAWENEYTGRRTFLKNRLHLATSKIHISTDVWTSEEKTNYLAVVAHFLDEHYKLQTILLDLPCLKGPHSGENIAALLSKVIDFYDISAILGFFVMDNASNNDTCIKELAKKYLTVTPQMRIRCSGHILNIIVNALLFGTGINKLEQLLCGASDDQRFEIWRKHSFIGKLHNFCVWINRSDQRRELLKGYISEAYQGSAIERLYTRVLVDGGIRWNSVYKMVKRALKLRNAIDLFFHNYRYPANGEYDISQDELSQQDWIDLQHFLDILRPFHSLTKRMEGRANRPGLEGSHGSLYETLEALDVLFKKLREAGDYAFTHATEVSEYYATSIDTARLKLEEYFGLTDETPAYRVAVALHPANKFTYFELEWAHNKEWIREAKKVVEEAYTQYEAAANQEVEEEADERQEEEDVAVSTDDETRLDPLQQARKRRQRLAATVVIASTRNAKRKRATTELDEFMARTNRADLDVDNPLEWWVQHKSDYPILSRMAFDLFSCPAMSAECERVFSQTGKVITDERNRLEPGTVAALECQKHLLRSSLLD
jgi:hypothetical protein